MMGVFKSLAGMVWIELTSADITGSLAGLNHLGIPIFDVRMDGDLSARFRIYRRDWNRISAYAKRRGERLQLLGKRGLYWNLKRIVFRPVLMSGIILLLGLALFLPSRVLFVQVEGNATVPARRILEAAEESGIRFGASRRAVRSERMKNALLSAVPQLQWAGVNTYGCTAVISVRERAPEEEAEQHSGVSSIVAARDGVILSSTVTRGSGLCAAGQAVREGEILISGYTDCGLCITATRAEGEIMALTRRNLTVITPSETRIRRQHEAQSIKFSLIIGKKRINFYKGSGISDASCVKMYSEYALTLPGGFSLPVAVVKETIISCDTTASEYTEDQIADALSSFASDYLQQQMIAGRITDFSEQITAENGFWHLTGEYACVEMIGRRQDENGVVP